MTKDVVCGSSADDYGVARQEVGREACAVIREVSQRVRTTFYLFSSSMARYLSAAALYPQSYTIYTQEVPR